MIRSQNRLELLTICREAIVLLLCNIYPACPLESNNTTSILILIFVSQTMLLLLLIKLKGDKSAAYHQSHMS